jgi:hypothetical protein
MLQLIVIAVRRVTVCIGRTSRVVAKGIVTNDGERVN